MLAFYVWMCLKDSFQNPRAGLIYGLTLALSVQPFRITSQNLLPLVWPHFEGFHHIIILRHKWSVWFKNMNLLLSKLLNLEQKQSSDVELEYFFAVWTLDGCQNWSEVQRGKNVSVSVLITIKQAGAVLGSTSQLKPSFIEIDNVCMKGLWIMLL